jgi:hypothetical protein
MVNQNDLRELEKSIISQLTSQLATLGQQADLQRAVLPTRADLQKLGIKLENDVGDLKKLIEAKLSGLDQRVVALEDSISLTNAKITGKNGIVDRIKGLESLASLNAVEAMSTSEALKALETKTKALETSTEDSESAILEEIALIDKKRCNVVIFGIPAISHDADIKAVSDLLKGIDASSDFSCHRIGSVESQNRPLIVRFQSASSQDLVIRSAKKLRGHDQYNNISIKPDFTKRQRALNAQKEDTLRADAISRNASMPIGEINDYAWVVTGKPGNRHLVKKKQ